MSDTPDTLHGAPADNPATTPAAPLPAAALTAPVHPMPVRWSTGAWAVQGLRAAFFLRPRVPAGGVKPPGPWQVLALFAAATAAQAIAERWAVPGPAEFQPAAWLAPWWLSLALLWCAWCAMPRTSGRAAAALGGAGADECAGAVASAPAAGRLAAWFALTTFAPVPGFLAAMGLDIWAARAPEAAQAWAQTLQWAMLALTGWALAAFVWAGRPFFATRWRTAGFALATAVLVGVGTWTFPGPAWTQSPTADAAPEPEPLHLSQDVFEAQQALWQRQVQALAPQRDGVVDVYGLVFAPYASENVFRRESTMVREVLEQRFGARGRVIQLLNHAQTATTHVWATPQNLQRAVAALGARMDRDHDVLVVYLTSHGGQDHRLAAMHWPLEVPAVSPEMLRQALDNAGIRHRVIAVSACFSGGWIDPLATDTTLVMTAADATHTSFGCGHRSELTFFGRAVFNEQLRSTRSFTQAFANAVPLIRQREIDAGKDDGFSNPQISVGVDIAPVLDALAARLDHEPSD